MFTHQSSTIPFVPLCLCPSVPALPSYACAVVEGAGGLLSPLGVDFDSRDLIVALKAEPIIVASNRLGVVNEVLLTLEALPGKFERRAQIVLVNPPRHDLASRTNPDLLRERVGPERVHVMPWLPRSAG